MDEYLLRVDNLVKKFPGTIALKGAQLHIRYGEIHALVGENGAGKSTMMNVISGVFSADEGTMIFDGTEGFFASPGESMEAGIGFVHQEQSLCDHLSAAENIFMGRVQNVAGKMIAWDVLIAEADKILDTLHADFKAGEKVASLSIAQRQMVEIARAISLNAKLVIFDEPTSSLTERETEILFRIVRDLKKRGISSVYISHRLTEIMDLCDRVTIMRDGCFISTEEVKDVDEARIISGMVGREITDLYPGKHEGTLGEVLLEVQHANGSRFSDVSFALRKGEILGFSGLVGAGRTELMRGVCAIDRMESGRVLINGSEVNLKRYDEAIEAGLCYMTEDRKKDGLFLTRSVVSNVSVGVLNRISSSFLKIINVSDEKMSAEKQIKAVGVKVSDSLQQISSLSGGNQQKALLGRWLALHPSILILDEPTRGVDVGAKSEIHKILRDLCESGMGIIVISSELPEIMGLSDRVAVMSEGKLMGELTGERITEENIMTLASGISL